jgi:hypothetical protein
MICFSIWDVLSIRSVSIIIFMFCMVNTHTHTRSSPLLFDSFFILIFILILNHSTRPDPPFFCVRPLKIRTCTLITLVIFVFLLHHSLSFNVLYCRIELKIEFTCWLSCASAVLSCPVLSVWNGMDPRSPYCTNKLFNNRNSISTYFKFFFFLRNVPWLKYNTDRYLLFNILKGRIRQTKRKYSWCSL